MWFRELRKLEDDSPRWPFTLGGGNAERDSLCRAHRERGIILIGKGLVKAMEWQGKTLRAIAKGRVSSEAEYAYLDEKVQHLWTV